ncbi:MAG: hypothetical protein JW716_05640 [Candidatus Aenigmarchaeota archaeon]|nr:hypothetical protein [Candidatus Aenigmarchaeota archaeon]
MKKNIALMTFLVALTLVTVSAMADVPTFGQALIGIATINGNPAPVDTPITAWNGGTQVGSSEVGNSDGWYKVLDVSPLPEGTIISFKIGDNLAVETFTIPSYSDFFRLDLSATSACTNPEDRLSVTTDQADYDQGEDVTISGTLLDEDCNPVVGEQMGVQVNDPYDNPVSYQPVTDANGYFETSFTLDTDALLGTYLVTVGGNGDSAQTSFDVNEPLCEPQWQCGEWEPEVCPESGFRTRECIDMNCGLEPVIEPQDCEYIPPCVEDWVCTEWEPVECPESEIQTRICTDNNACGTEVLKPTEEQGCIYVPDCSSGEDRLTVETDQAEYYPGHDVTIFGTLLDEECNPVVGENMAIQVRDSLDNPFSDQATTNSQGYYEYTYTLDTEAPLGTYTVTANGNGDTAQTTFDVVECIEDWTYTQWSMCLPTNEQIRFGYDMNQCGTTDDREELTQECTFEGPTDCTGFYIEVTTDMPYYEGASNGAVYGFLLDEDCNPINGADIDLLGEPNLFEETVQTFAGVFSYEFSLGELNEYGQYTVTATYNGGVPVGPTSIQVEADPVIDETTFYYVETCDADGDTHTIPECGGDDCNDNDAAVYPGASCETGCSNTGATYDATCTCTGGTDTCYKGGGGGTYGGGGGYYSCTPDWICTDWSECMESETQTRTCEDTNKCGTDTNKPAETQTCTYVAPPKFEGPLVVCGDGACEGDETCNTCEEDCGTCPIPPTGAICGNSICESTENCEKCESDCGKCQEPELPAAGQDGLTGLVPGGVAGLGGIIVLIVAIVGIGYFYSVRKK